MSAYYNEIDPFAAEWLRQLINAGHIADGVVDERSIEDIKPNELKEFTQCHFFAGIGVWSYALRQAGWPDDRPIWTGSCPCQPFSSAGKGKGTADERHLWPAFHWLIKQCRPDIVLGEQVAQKAGAAWFDLVSTDLEGEDYTCGKVVFPACGIGAPLLRQRIYWVACTSGTRSQDWLPKPVEHQKRVTEKCGNGSKRRTGNADRSQDGWVCRTCRFPIFDGCQCDHGELQCPLCGEWTYPFYYNATDGCQFCGSDSIGKTNNFWREADWLVGRTGKWYPVEPGTFPLAHGSPARVGRLRGYGNAIVGPQAQAFIEAVCEALTEQACF